MRELEVEEAVAFTVLLEERGRRLLLLSLGGTSRLEFLEGAQADSVTELGDEIRCVDAGTGCALLKNGLDLFGMSHQIFVALAHRADFGVDLVGEALLGLTPAKTVTEFLTEGGGFFFGGEGVVNDGERGAVGILGLTGQTAVGDDAGDRFVKRLAAALKERDHVVVGLAHLAAVETGEDFNGRAARGLRKHKEGLVGLGVEIVEARGDVTGHFKVLDLVVTDGHFVGVEHEDVGGHEDGVAEQAHRDVGIRILACGNGSVGCSLVGMSTVHLTLARAAGQHPVEERNFRNVALSIEHDAFRIEACGKPRSGDLHAAAFDAVRVLALDEGVKVSHEEEALHVRILAVLDGRANGADVIADVEGAGRVDAGQNSLFHVCVFHQVGWTDAPLGRAPSRQSFNDTRLSANKKTTCRILQAGFQYCGVS